MSHYTEYVQALPAGLASFPDCMAKASMVRTAFQTLPLNVEQPGLPDLLKTYLSTPPLANAWIPETEYVAVCLAIADAHGLDTAGFQSLWYGSMQRMTKGLYAALLGWVSPHTLLRTLATRWDHFHLGTTAAATALDDSLEICLEYPEPLWPDLIVKGYVSVFQALVDRSSKPDARVRLIAIDTIAPGKRKAKYLAEGWLR